MRQTEPPAEPVDHLHQPGNAQSHGGTCDFRSKFP